MEEDLQEHSGDEEEYLDAEDNDRNSFTDEEEEIKNEESKENLPAYFCPHYHRHCAFLTPCCKKIYTCRLCHNEDENHELDRHSVMEIKCLKCDTMQEVRRECANCGQEFGKYFCEICRLYDDVDKKQFHCSDCGICRIGGRENFFHCKKCDMCLGIDLLDSHKCVESVAHSNCPICMEDLHSSTLGCSVLKCGHIVHGPCYEQMMRNGIYACPLCGVSTRRMSEVWRALDDEIAQVQMPEEYRDTKVWILCKDCHLKSETAFHVIGLKCHGCGSYNTCNTANPNEAAAAVANPDAAAAALGNPNEAVAAVANPDLAAAALANPNEAAAAVANPDAAAAATTNPDSAAATANPPLAANAIDNAAMAAPDSADVLDAAAAGRVDH